MNPAPISIVIPTSNRKERLLSLLRNLDQLLPAVAEVIVVDASDQPLGPAEYTGFGQFTVQYITSEKSVCIQRNTGIRLARSPWVLLCDDDVELPVNYAEVLSNYAMAHPGTGAISGRWLEKVNGEWVADHPERSALKLFWKYIFGMSTWGRIETNHFLIRRIKKRYFKKGNHLSKAGWPVNILFDEPAVVFPVHSLGAALVKREWLLQSPFDEVLDRYGIGENYGVTLGFPVPGVMVLKDTAVYHQQEAANRLKKTLQYYRRVLALDHFIRVKKVPKHVKRRWLVWSLLGNLLQSFVKADGAMIKANAKAMTIIITGKNPYTKAAKAGKTVIEPDL